MATGRRADAGRPRHRIGETAGAVGRENRRAVRVGTRDDDVRKAVAGDVADRDRVRSAVALARRSLIDRRERTAAVADEDRDRARQFRRRKFRTVGARVRGDDVGVAVAGDVTDRDREWFGIRSDRIADRRCETARAVARKHRHIERYAVRGDDVDLAVAGHIAGGNRIRRIAAVEIHRVRETAGAVAREHGHVGALAVRRHDVELAVAGDVGQRDRARKLRVADVVVRGSGEAAAAIAGVDQDRDRVESGRGKIRVFVAVDVAERDDDVAELRIVERNAHRRRETAGAVAEQHGDVVAETVAGHDVGMAVAGQVRRRDRRHEAAVVEMHRGRSEARLGAGRRQHRKTNDAGDAGE